MTSRPSRSVWASAVARRRVGLRHPVDDVLQHRLQRRDRRTQLVRDVGDQFAALPVGRGQVGRHLVERAGELTDLVPGGGPYPPAVVAPGHRPGGRGHLPQRRRHAVRQHLQVTSATTIAVTEVQSGNQPSHRREPGHPGAAPPSRIRPSLDLDRPHRVQRPRQPDPSLAPPGRSRRRAPSGSGPRPSLRRSALMWLSTVRVPDASAQPHTSASSRSRGSTVRGRVARCTSRSNSVGRQVRLDAGPEHPPLGPVDLQVAERGSAAAARLGRGAARPGAAARAPGRPARASRTAWSGSRRRRPRARPAGRSRRRGR